MIAFTPACSTLIKSDNRFALRTKMQMHDVLLSEQAFYEHVARVYVQILRSQRGATLNNRAVRRGTPHVSAEQLPPL